MAITVDNKSSTRFLKLSDGRKLAFAEYGDPGGHPVFYAHGGPGSRLEGLNFHEKAAHYGLRFIATDRPGMGKSTFLPERTILDYPKDIEALAEALRLDRFGVMGWSGGGAHTTVCAFAIPERLTFNISLAGYTNFAELPGAAEMLRTKADRMAVRLSQRRSRLFGLFFELLRLNVKYFPELYFKALWTASNEPDRKILSDPAFKENFLADQHEAVAQGSRGLALDSEVHYVDWGFSLKEITVKIHVFHGSEDGSVPLAYAEHLAENVPNCELHILEGQGHLFPEDHQELIFETALAEL